MLDLPGAPAEPAPPAPAPAGAAPGDHEPEPEPEPESDPADAFAHNRDTLRKRAPPPAPLRSVCAALVLMSTTGKG